MNIHSEEFAQLQRERMRKTKPWLKTKGAITPEGKARSKMNALKKDPVLHELEKEYQVLMKSCKGVRQTILGSINISKDEN